MDWFTNICSLYNNAASAVHAILPPQHSTLIIPYQKEILIRMMYLDLVNQKAIGNPLNITNFIQNIRF